VSNCRSPCDRSIALLRQGAQALRAQDGWAFVRCAMAGATRIVSDRRPPLWRRLPGEALEIAGAFLFSKNADGKPSADCVV